ncbi:MAG TPA: FecR domain-containing protein, partial [Gammaproteobacteria bacterium]
AGTAATASAAASEPAIAESPAAAKIRALAGRVWMQGDGGAMRQLRNGDEVHAGSQIVTGRKSHVTIRFSDESVFSLGPNSQMVVDKYAYDKDPEKNSLTTRIIKGTFRFVSGLIAKARPDNMNVNLGPVATIGIRGTHVAGEVNERREKDGKVVEASAKVMLMEPEEGDAPSAIIVSNEYGSVVVDQPGYGTEIPDEHSPPAPVRKMQVRTINKLMRAIRSSVPRSMPKVRVP